MITALERRDALVMPGSGTTAMPCRQILRDDWGMFLAAAWLQDGGRPLFLTLGHAWTTTAGLRVLRLNFRLFPTHVDALRLGLEVLVRGVPCAGSALSAYQLVRGDLQPCAGHGRAVLLERVSLRAQDRRLVDVDVGAGEILQCDLELAQDLDLAFRGITTPADLVRRTPAARPPGGRGMRPQTRHDCA